VPAVAVPPAPPTVAAPPAPPTVAAAPESPPADPPLATAPADVDGLPPPTAAAEDSRQAALAEAEPPPPPEPAPPPAQAPTPPAAPPVAAASEPAPVAEAPPAAPPPAPAAPAPRPPRQTRPPAPAGPMRLDAGIGALPDPSFGARAMGAVVPPGTDSGQRNAPPDYPSESRRRGEEGVVRLALRVGIDGQVEAAEVAVSSGFPRLDAAAVEAARRWRFRPATQGGLPVAATLPTAVHFRLTDARGR
jgi:protein TonB